MHIAWISLKITFSELKQPWSVLLQSKNSAIFRAETASIRTKNLWSLLIITEHRLTFMKISEHYWKCLRTAEYLWKSMVISENVWISRKNIKNFCFNSETFWKPLLALLIADWSSTYVLSNLYEQHLRKTPYPHIAMSHSMFFVSRAIDKQLFAFFRLKKKTKSLLHLTRYSFYITSVQKNLKTDWKHDVTEHLKTQFTAAKKVPMTNFACPRFP